MEVVLATMAMDQPGGLQSYVLTIAPHLERLGHPVTIFSPAAGPMSDLALERGLRFCSGERDLPQRCDAVISQDAPSALLMAERYPDAVRGCVVHSADLDVVLPPAHQGVVSFAVALNSVAERRLRSTAHPPAVVRLTQPIDTAHLYPAVPISPRPRHVLLLGNWLHESIREGFVAVCEAAGLEWREVGAGGESCRDPLGPILASDIVVGLGRSALDAMSCGRAVWVLGSFASDGWVTAESYPALEADGLRGRASDAVLTADDFGRELGRYDASMGQVNRQLVVLRHSPYDHAMGLVEVVRRSVPVESPPAPLREMARLVRTQYDSQARVAGLANELRAIQTRLEGEVEWHRRRWEELVRTRRWRIVQQAAWPLDAARRMHRRLQAVLGWSRLTGRS